MTSQTPASIEPRSFLRSRRIVAIMTGVAIETPTRGPITFALRHLVRPLHHVPAHERAGFEDCHRIEERGPGAKVLEFLARLCHPSLAKLVAIDAHVITYSWR